MAKAPGKNRLQGRLTRALQERPELREKLRKLEAQWEETEKRQIDRANEAFTYIEWALVFGVIDYARMTSAGLNHWGLLGLQCALVLLVFWHSVNKYDSLLQHLRRYGDVWDNILTMQTPILLLRSAFRACIFLALGMWLSSIVQRATAATGS